jgi:hypothetical protein
MTRFTAWFVALWLAAYTAEAAVPPIEEPVHSAEAVLSHVAEALGGIEAIRRVGNVYARSKYEGSGGVGYVDEWKTAAGQRRQSNVMSGRETLTVFAGDHGWVRNEGGRVRRLSDTEVAAGKSAAYIGSFSFLVSGRMAGRVRLRDDAGSDHYVLELTPDGGITTRLVVDRKTFLPVRQEEWLVQVMLEIQFLGWRESAGVRFPAGLRLTTSDGLYQATETIVELRTNVEIASSLFDEPPAGPPDYRFTTQDGRSTFDFEDEGGPVYVLAQIGKSRPLWFRLDSRIADSVLDLGVAKSLGLKLDGARPSGEPSRAAGAVLHLPGVEISSITFLLLPLDALARRRGAPVDGILGSDIFERFMVQVSYPFRRVTLSDPTRHRYAGRGTPIPITRNASAPTIEATVMADVVRAEGRFVVDTGSAASIVLGEHLQSSTLLLDGMERRLPVTVQTSAGAIEGVIGRVGALEIGAISVRQPIAMVAAGYPLTLGTDGIIGTGVLRQFVVTFDYRNEQLFLEQVDGARAVPDEYDTSGLELVGDAVGGATVQIQRVSVDTPGADAGLRAGDLIVAVDGRPVAQIGLAQLRRLFRIVGQTHRLTIRRGDQVLEAELTLRRLI